MIALSYRREDSVAIAGRLYDRLQSEFGRGNVFMDFDSIPAGVDFRQHIMRAIERSHVVIALIGPNWLADKWGFRRIDDPEDFVRFEVSAALARGIPVIPVLVNDTEMPDADQLPPELQPLAFRNALPLDSGLDFHSHAERLVGALRAIPTANRLFRASRRPIAFIVAGLVAAALISFGLIEFLKPNPDATAKQENRGITKAPAGTIPQKPAPSSSATQEEELPTSSPSTPEPSVSAVPLRDFRGRWSSINSSPIAGNGTLTVRDQLVVEKETITETITTDWVSEKTTVFRITLRVRFGELWAFRNQLNARCLAADVTDVFDPKDFGKYANMTEQTTNAAKAGVSLVYTWTLDRTGLRRGGMTWTREK